MSKKKIDAEDAIILNLIQENASLTNKELGDKVGKSASAVQTRIKQIQDMGIIKGIVAILDRNKINKKMTFFSIVKLKKCTENAISEFCAHIIPLDEIAECYQMNGEWDFLLKIVVADMEEYSKFINKSVSNIPHLGKINSNLVTYEAKCKTSYKINPENY